MPQLDMGAYIERYNPFMYKDEKNRIMHFETYKDAYLQTMRFIVKDCPRGYFDIAVFMKKHCGMDDQTVVDYDRIATKTSHIFLINRILMFDWRKLNDDGNNRKIMIEILRALHNITETTFSYEAFEWALEIFIKEDINETYKENDG